MSEIRHTIQDSVFTDLFSDRGNLLGAYLRVHPEDTGVTPDDIDIVTLKALFTPEIYNDLSFTVNGRTVLFFEAQSTWTQNIPLKSLMYIVDGYREHLSATGQSIHDPGAVKIPFPEAYMVYSGEEKHEETELSLSDAYWKDRECCLELTVKVLYENGRDIISQYLAFTRYLRECCRKYGKTREAILKTIRRCIREGILKDYLRKNEARVIKMEEYLFSQEEITKSLIIANTHKVKQEAQQEYLYNLTEYLMESGQESDRDRAEAKARQMLKLE